MNGYLVNHANSNIALYTGIPGFLATHVCRTCMRRFAPRIMSLPKAGWYLLLAIFLTTGLATALKGLAIYYFQQHDLSWSSVFLTIPADYLLLIIPWMLIYWGYRLEIRNRAQTIERRRLEWRLREMQRKAGESGITMDGLMEEISHIIALIDENPASARNEITLFSRHLREGYLD